MLSINKLPFIILFSSIYINSQISEYKSILLKKIDSIINSYKNKNSKS